MISITKLLCGTEYYGDSLRYNPSSGRQSAGAAVDSGPVVVWSMTRACNLSCIHCYAAADSACSKGELTTGEAVKFIDDLAAFKVPVLLLSGGEPLLRPDFFDLAAYAKQRGIRLTLSSNGTLITADIARRLKEAGISYVGISLDGIGQNNDRFRGRQGAFALALQGIRNCLVTGQKVGLRFTVSRQNLAETEAILDLIEKENIPRACFYHLAYAGRASSMVDQDITHFERRAFLDLIIKRVQDLYQRGQEKEILTVNNHADGVYLYLKLRRDNPEKSAAAYQLLGYNGGNRTGIAIGAVDWEGYVHPDQFTMHHTFGNVKERGFAEIWRDGFHPLLAGLRNRRLLLKGRCGACRWLDICNGNSRGRAEAVYGDYWASDPACYLSDEEIGLEPAANRDEEG